jgi:hypothetical protein
LTPYLPKKFCRWVTQSGMEVVLMLAWEMITSPAAAIGFLLGAAKINIMSKANRLCFFIEPAFEF